MCLNGATGFEDESPFFLSVETTDIPLGFEQCQIVSAGETVEFLLKDGSGCGGVNGATASLNNGEATCAPRLNAVSSCTGNGNDDGKECIWRTVAPSSCEEDVLCE